LKILFYLDIGRLFMMEQIDNPIEAAEYFAKIENSNFLAHSIRKIEYEFIREMGVPYRIFTHVSPKINNAITLFLKTHCIIYLPQSQDERLIRLALGHELGHLIFRFNELKESKEFDNNEASDYEEVFAWVFAYNLIRLKSDLHEQNQQMGKFIYEKGQLKTELLNIIREKKPKILNEVSKILDFDE